MAVALRKPPPGVPASFYAKLVALARKKRVKTLLHASGDALARRHCRAPFGGDAQSEGGRAPARPVAAHPHALSGSRGRDPVLGAGSGGAVARQPRRRGRVRRRTVRGDSAARRSGLPHRSGRCFNRGLRLAHEQGPFDCRGRAAMGRGRRHGVRAAAGDELRIPRRYRKHVPRIEVRRAE